MEEIEKCIVDLEYEAVTRRGGDSIWLDNARRKLRNAIEIYALKKEKASLLEVAQAMYIPDLEKYR